MFLPGGYHRHGWRRAGRALAVLGLALAFHADAAADQAWVAQCQRAFNLAVERCTREEMAKQGSNLTDFSFHTRCTDKYLPGYDQCLAGQTSETACNWEEAKINIDWVLKLDKGAQRRFKHFLGAGKAPVDAVIEAQSHNANAQETIRRCRGRAARYIAGGEPEITSGARQFSNGTFRGQLRNGRPHGRGVFTWNDGRRFAGEFRNGEMTGQGVLTYPDGRRYRGGFKDGKFHGQGTFTTADGRTVDGHWQDGKQTRAGDTGRPRRKCQDEGPYGRVDQNCSRDDERYPAEPNAPGPQVSDLPESGPSSPAQPGGSGGMSCAEAYRLQGDEMFELSEHCYAHKLELETLGRRLGRFTESWDGDIDTFWDAVERDVDGATFANEVHKVCTRSDYVSSQMSAFDGCSRVYLCGFMAAACAEDLAEGENWSIHEPDGQCRRAGQQCLQLFPVPRP